MDNELRAMQVAAGSTEGQAEVVASTPSIPENQVSAEMAVDTPAEVTPAATEASVSEPATPASEVVASEAQTPSVNEPYSYWPDLEQKTEGLVKDEETLTEVLTKAKSYETLVAEKEELQKTLFKPANEYISKLNELTLNGASPDQIKAFVKLNGYGDLESLSPIDLKVTRMVLKEGFSEEIARKIVERKYDFKQYNEEIPEQKEEADILREQLRVDARQDLEALKEYKKELSVVDNPEKENAERIRLQGLADLSTYNKTVEKEAPAIAKHFPEKLNYEFKIGDEVIPYEDNIDKQFLEKELAEHVKEYFKDSLDPITPQTVNQAYSFALGEYLKANNAQMLERAYTKGYNAATEKTVNRYENKSGLPKAQENQVITTNETGLSDFLKQMVGRT